MGPNTKLLTTLTHPDLFHLSLCLSPTVPGVSHLPHYPLGTYICVFCLSVPVRLVCSSLPAFCVSAPAFPSLSFLTLLVLTPACPDSEPACLTLSLPAVLYLGLQLSTTACLDLSFPCPGCYIKHNYFTVCTWVLLWFLIKTKDIWGLSLERRSLVECSVTCHETVFVSHMNETKR